MLQGKLILEHIHGAKNKFKVMSGFKYTSEKYHIEIEVLPGWETDGASVPQIFWNIASPLAGRYVEAAVLHDALYMAEAIPRMLADKIFLECMKEMGTPFIKRWIMYTAVRTFGWYVWSKHDPSNVKKAKKYVKITFK